MLRWLAAVGCSTVLFFFGTGVAIVPVPALAWLAPLPVLLLAPRVSGWAAVAAAATAFFLSTSNSWGFYLHSSDTPPPVGLAFSAVFTAMFALSVALFGVLLRRGLPLPATLATPAVWTGCAYLLQVANPMGLMGTFANSQGDVPLVLQPASVTGAWGVDYLVLLAPVAMAAVCAPGVTAGARWRAGVCGVLVLALALGYGAVRLAGAGESGSGRQVALLVHNRAEWGVDAATPAGRKLVASYRDRIAALPDRVRTVVLPEGTFSADDRSLPTLLRPLRDVARDRDVDVVFGMVHHADGEKWQTALTIPAGGGTPARYLKHHDRVSPPANGLTFPPVSGTRLGIAICLDINFADPSRRYAAAGAQLLTVPASDERENGWMHSRVATLRGVENGVGTAWPARQGRLTVSDGYGRVLADASSVGGGSAFTTSTAAVPNGPGATWYTRTGDWFAWLCLALAVGGTVLAAARRPARTPANPPPHAGS